jgi:hypothetical protein
VQVFDTNDVLIRDINIGLGFTFAADKQDNIYVDTGLTGRDDGSRLRKYLVSGDFIDLTKVLYLNVDGQFSDTRGIAIDSSNNIFIADNRVQKFRQY